MFAVLQAEVVVRGAFVRGWCVKKSDIFCPKWVVCRKCGCFFWWIFWRKCS